MIEDSKVQVEPLEVFGVRDECVGVGLGSNEWFMSHGTKKWVPSPSVSSHVRQN